MEAHQARPLQPPAPVDPGRQPNPFAPGQISEPTIARRLTHNPGIDRVGFRHLLRGSVKAASDRKEIMF